MQTDLENKGNIPTLEDVAKRAGVSTATVSRCLNSPTQVTDRTRERVMAAVKDLGYAPNFGARALAAKRTNTFGAIVPTIESSIFARGLQALQEELGDHGINLLVASSSYKPELEEDQIRSLIARGADALFLIGYERTVSSYEFLRQRQVPYVIAWAHDPSQSLPSIGFDNRQAMQELAEQVIALGHRSLALISANREGNDRARERAEGVLAAMRHHGLDPASLHIVETPYSISNGGDALAQILKDAPETTAALCGNDVLAAGALTMARSLGLRVPQDISITGFDDIEIAEIVSPRLTTVHVPHRKMGRQAAKLLVELRNEGTAGPSIVLDTSVVWGESLGPARTKPLVLELT
ncbi:MAG: LacI family DNA-binding transcriptional regulator [Pseudomonadota bacterium]